MRQRLSRRLKHTPGTTRVNRTLRLSPGRVQRFLILSHRPVSLSIHVNSGRSARLRRLLRSSNVSPRAFATRRSLGRSVHGLLSRLAPRRGRIVALHCNLRSNGRLSLTGINGHVGVDHRQIHRLRRRTLGRLHHHGDTVRNCVTD